MESKEHNGLLELKGVMDIWKTLGAKQGKDREF